MVLAIVALTVYALLRRFHPAKEVMALLPQQRAVPPDLVTDLVNPRRVRDPAVGYLMVPAVLARLLVMELVLALAIGVLAGSGVWLLLRTFQVLLGFSLVSYAVNLFIFSMGSLAMDEEPILGSARTSSAGRRRSA